jgi:hypothetical protein
MKRILMLGVSFILLWNNGFGQNIKILDTNQPQEVYAFGTNSSQDGYVTLGFTLGEWGVYGGLPHTTKSVLNTTNGSVSRDLRFGMLKQLQRDKVIFGVGAQPTSDGTKLHSFVGYNPLKSKDMKLWMIGNITGSVFSFGAGLSYVIKNPKAINN